jgi:glyoxylase-like metal-dependent hydrolase (beta-lactamase superfamily II)
MTQHRFSANRRRLIAGATGAAFGAVPLRALAQDTATPAASPVAEPAVESPDMTGEAYPFPVGAFTCTSVSDGANAAPGADAFLFSGGDPAAVQQALAEAGIDPATFVLQHTSTLIDTGAELVLVDTGAGTPALPESGILVDNLRRIGVHPPEIGVVVLTHGHPDHIGGNLAASGSPLYSNARYVMAQEEWDFWSDPARVEGLIPDAETRQRNLDAFQANVAPLEGMIELIGYDEEIVPGVTSVAAQGHTPGHMGLRVESEGELLWVLGDAALHPLHLRHPEFTAGFDTEPERTTETRMALCERIVAEGGMVTFNHFDPFPSLGEIAAEGEAWAWQPVEVSAEDDGS